MMWFNGSIASAVDKVKSANALLLVFVKGDDYMSSVYEKVLDDEDTFKGKNYIAIKILHNSVAFEQFQQIYVAVPVPSVFILEPNGIPSSIISSHDMQELMSSLTKVVRNDSNENYGRNDSQNDEISISKDFENCKFVVEDKKIGFERETVYRNIFLYETHYCGKSCLFPKIQSARIQFRFPSNEIRSWEFPSMCTLRDVKLFLMETIKLGPGFKLHRVCPRAAFTSQDEDKTLTDLSLFPSATLIVVPLPDEAIHTKIKKLLMKNKLVSSLVFALIQPVLSLIGYFRSFMVKALEEEKSVNRKKARDSDSKRFSKKISSSNVHGFAFDESDTDPDMNTDNGNSTQQM